ncbi:MAG: hypothetical protein LBJ61_12625 [Deltaproteobacteria bacterium]|jgi:hypothetical protein|nr:hypothetical protein [Deltaproteobacteria bacterium]
MLALALRNGYGKNEQTVLISDCASWIRNMKELFFCDAQQILDYFHLCENISKYVKSVFEPDSIELKDWIKTVTELFKESKTKTAIQMIKKLNFNGKRPSGSFNLLGYIENNSHNIDYPFYRQKGWLIGSGYIESGNKSVLQQRLKKQGMRWTTQNGQFILTLMSKAKSLL